MNSIFNSPFELSLRILILMKTRNSRVTVDWLSCLDFVTTYGKDFGVSEFNLHGDANLSSLVVTAPPSPKAPRFLTG